MKKERNYSKPTISTEIMKLNGYKNCRKSFMTMRIFTLYQRFAHKFLAILYKGESWQTVTLNKYSMLLPSTLEQTNIMYILS